MMELHKINVMPTTATTEDCDRLEQYLGNWYRSSHKIVLASDILSIALDQNAHSEIIMFAEIKPVRCPKFQMGRDGIIVAENICKHKQGDVHLLNNPEDCRFKIAAAEANIETYSDVERFPKMLSNTRAGNVLQMSSDIMKMQHKEDFSFLFHEPSPDEEFFSEVIFDVTNAIRFHACQMFAALACALVLIVLVQALMIRDADVSLQGDNN